MNMRIFNPADLTMKDTFVPDHYLQQFGQTLEMLQANSPPIADYFCKHLHLVSLTRGAILLEAGQVCDHYYYICEGAIRGFFREDSQEVTTWISVNGEFVTSISSLDLHQPAYESMQAIEDSYLLAMTNRELDELYSLYPEFNRAARLLLQQYYRDAEARAYISRLKNAETKYRHFIARYGHLANRVQLQYIASFLGVTLETLSRVRRKMTGQKQDEGAK